MNKKIYRLVSILAAFALTLGRFSMGLAAPAVMPLMSENTYYVSVTGDDANAGTLTAPFRTIKKALSVAQAGTSIYVRAGTYPSFTVTTSGTETSPLIIAGYQDEVPVISGGIGIRLTKVSYVTIHGFEVTKASGKGAQRMGGVVISGGGNNTIEYCKIHHNLVDIPNGIKIKNSSNNRILHNTVYNNGNVGIMILGTASPKSVNNEIGWNTVYGHTKAGRNSDGIGLKDRVGSTYIHDNEVYGNADDGIDTWNTTHNILVGNIVHDQVGPGDGNGFKLGGGTGGHNIVKQNIAYGNKLNGFDANGTGGNVYYNNIAYDNGNFGFEDGWKNSTCTPTTCQQTFINNIGYNNEHGNFSASVYTAISHNNLWFSDNGSAKVFYKYTAYSSLAAFYKASGNRLDNPAGGELASLKADPLFTDAVNKIFTVQSSSPAIDQGDPANPGEVTAINRVDIGAFENNLNSAQTAASNLTATGFTSTASTSTDKWTNEAVSETVYDDLNGDLVYSLGWQNQSDSQAYDGSFQVTVGQSASASLSFTGESFSILYTSGPNYCNMDVYVDNDWVATIDQTTTLSQYQQSWAYPGQLPMGTHTLTLIAENEEDIHCSLDAVTTH